MKVTPKNSKDSSEWWMEREEFGANFFLDDFVSEILETWNAYFFLIISSRDKTFVISKVEKFEQKGLKSWNWIACFQQKCKLHSKSMTRLEFIGRTKMTVQCVTTIKKFFFLRTKVPTKVYANRGSFDLIIPNSAVHVLLESQLTGPFCSIPTLCTYSTV